MQINSEIIEVLEYLGQKFGIAIDWTAENVQPYLEELAAKFITWETQTSIAWIVIAGTVTVLALVAAVALSFFSDYEVEGWCTFVGIAIIAIIMISCQVFDIIECKTLPEKAIFDYIRQYKVMN